MKFTATKSITLLWMMFLLTGLSLISASSRSFAATPKIGDSFGGGIVFYVDGTGQHGLIVAKTNTEGHSEGKEEGVLNWYDANVAANVFVEGYSDWFLPNKEQLHQLYLNKSAVGGILDTYFWSSSESDANSAWAEYFFNGKQVAGSKLNGSCVRAVRAF
jgi:hypothetical protein